MEAARSGRIPCRRLPRSGWRTRPAGGCRTPRTPPRNLSGARRERCAPPAAANHAHADQPCGPIALDRKLKPLGSSLPSNHRFSQRLHQKCFTFIFTTMRCSARRNISSLRCWRGNLYGWRAKQRSSPRQGLEPPLRHLLPCLGGDHRSNLRQGRVRRGLANEAFRGSWA